MSSIELMFKSVRVTDLASFSCDHVQVKKRRQ